MYQFIHVDSYSNRASKHKRKTSGVVDVASACGEAAREAAFIKHVKGHEAEPIVLHGLTLDEVRREAERWQKDNKVRADGLAMVAGVVSAPNDLSDDAWMAYKAETLHYLGKLYGDRLKSVVEHTDEPHRHIHFFCVPQDGEKFESLHAGYAAKYQARREKRTTGEQNTEYRKAMEAFQADFHAKVAQGFGLAKDGPKRARKPRAVYLAERDAAQIIATAKAEAAKVLEKAKEQGFQEGVTARVEQVISAPSLNKVEVDVGGGWKVSPRLAAEMAKHRKPK